MHVAKAFIILASSMLPTFVYVAIGHAAEVPKMICYSIQPNEYLNDHAREVAKIYDGFFFTIGSWENVAERFVGGKGKGPTEQAWLDAVRENVTALRKAGATENLLGVSFSSNGPWPSAEQLLSGSYTETMARQFGAVGKVANALGFRGVSIDVEYPYPRYELDHEIYSYENYSADDLLTGAEKQGRRCMATLLDEDPEAVIFILPGDLRSRPIGRQYMLGLLKEMAHRDAPGGLHLGTEYTYCMQDTGEPVTALATCRFEDLAIQGLAGASVARYWRQRCTMAPGLWPLHMVETGGKDYPIQPWADEITELGRQLAAVRSVAKRYIWSYSGNPLWYVYDPELEKQYGLKKQSFKRDDVDPRAWHALLRDRRSLLSPGLKPLVERIRAFDGGKLTDEEFCDGFGTPGRWWMLGPLGNPHTLGSFAAAGALQQPIDPGTIYHGKDGVVRWVAYDNLDPRGVTNLKYFFDYRNTDDAAVHLVSFVHCPERRKAFLHVGWDDGIIVRLKDKVVFEAADYPERGKGMLYRDKYQFEKRVPIRLDQGGNRLAVTSMNARGSWVFALRITDERDIPFGDLRFRLK